MPRMSPEQARRRLHAWTVNTFPDVMAEQLRVFDRRAGAKAVQPPHMRDGRLDPGAASRIRSTRTGRTRRTGYRFPARRSTDKGPLRKLTNSLARAMRPGGRGAVSRVEVAGYRVKLRKGVRRSVVPYAAIHEFGGSYTRLRDGAHIRIRQRAYLNPAARSELPAARRRLANAAIKSIRASLARPMP